MSATTAPRAAFVWHRLWLCVPLMLLAAMASAQTAAPSDEYRIKAAFLHKFLSYVEWPAAALAQPGAPFVIGVVGPAEVVQELRRVTDGQTVAGHAVTVRRLTTQDPPLGLHVLYLVGDDGDAPAAQLAAAAGLPVLTVTESHGDGSGIINFAVDENRVRFDIALPAADANHLKISARLLNVARRVTPRG